MLRNYFTIAGHDVTKHKSYALISILGLAFGICTCIVIFLVTDYAFSFDNFDCDDNRVYRIEGAMRNSFESAEILNSGVNELRSFKDLAPALETKAGSITYSGSIRTPSANELLKKFDHSNLCIRRR